MIRTNKLKSALKSGKRVFGTWSMLSSPVVMDVIAQAGLDFIIIDMEHGPMSFETAEKQIYVADASNTSPVVRLGEGTEQNILHALEIGAQSLLVSHVSTAEEAKRIVRATKYHPEGDRGLSPFTRSHGYSDKDMKDKLRVANEQMFVGVLVEGKEGLNNLEKICATPGLDMVYLGLYDISQSMGIPGEVRDKKVVKMMQECARLISGKGLIAGSVACDKDYIKLLYESGFRFISYRVDCAVLREGFEAAQNWYHELS